MNEGLAFPDHLQSLAVSDTEYPRPKLPSFIIVRQPPQHLDHGLLRRILSVLDIAKHLKKEI